MDLGLSKNTGEACHEMVACGIEPAHLWHDSRKSLGWLGLHGPGQVASSLHRSAPFNSRPDVTCLNKEALALYCRMASHRTDIWHSKMFSLCEAEARLALNMPCWALKCRQAQSCLTKARRMSAPPDHAQSASSKVLSPAYMS